MSVSSHGNDFRALVGATLKNLESGGTVNDLKENTRISGQFFAPFFFRVGNKQCVIFCTTSARSDRLKSHQWDAWGIKHGVGEKNIKIFVVVPNNLVDKELAAAQKEAVRVQRSDYVSMIDSIIFLSDLSDFLKNL